MRISLPNPALADIVSCVVSMTKFGIYHVKWYVVRLVYTSVPRFIESFQFAHHSHESVEHCFEVQKRSFRL